MVRKLTGYLSLLFCFLAPISQLASSRLLIVLVALSFFIKLGPFRLKNFLLQQWDIALFFFTLILGLTYSQNLYLGLRQLETMLCLLGLPIVIFNYGTVSKESLTTLFYAFISGLGVACLICLAVASIHFFTLPTPNWDMFLYETLTKPLGAQPTYFAYYLVFAITVGLYKFYFDLHRKYLWLALLLLSFYFLMLLLTGSQTVFISLLFVFSFFLAKYLIQRSSKRESIAVVFVVVAIGSMAAWATIGPLQNSSHTNTDYWERFTLWEAALHTNSNWWTGVGTGDYEDALNQYYRNHQLGEYAKNNFNAHNQYIQILLSNGIIGIVALLVLMLRPLYLAVLAKDLLGVLLLYPFLLYGITEVFLGRYQGVLFFGIIHQLLSNYYLKYPSVNLAKVDKLRGTV
jgi:O-antigen ligase